MKIYINENFKMDIESLKKRYSSLKESVDKEFDIKAPELATHDLNNVYADMTAPDCIKFYIRSPQQISFIAKHLAKDFQNNYNLRLSLSELLMNSLEHGNLKINAETKHEMISSGSYYELLEHLVETNAEKHIELEYKFSEPRSIKISDQGEGFSYNQYLSDPEFAEMTYSGRGINLARTELPKNNADFKYLEKGNKLVINFD